MLEFFPIDRCDTSQMLQFYSNLVTLMHYWANKKKILKKACHDFISPYNAASPTRNETKVTTKLTW